MESLINGQLGAVSIIVWTLGAFVAAMVGGAVSGIALAGKDLGNELAAMMGAMFGPTGAVPGVLIALVILALV